MSNNTLTFYLTKTQEKLLFLTELPGKYRSLDDTQKTTVLVIAATTSIFIAIGCVFGFMPFVCTSIGYFIPHLVQKYSKAETPSDLKIHYAIGAALCYILFNLGALIGYAIGACLYTIEPITQHRINGLSVKKEPTESLFFKKLLEKDRPWINKEGKPISMGTKINNLRKVGIKNIKSIEKLWTDADNAIVYELNAKLKKTDYRINSFLELLSKEQRKKYVEDYGWPDKIPYRGISFKGVIDSLWNFGQKQRPVASANEEKGS